MASSDVTSKTNWHGGRNIPRLGGVKRWRWTSAKDAGSLKFAGCGHRIHCGELQGNGGPSARDSEGTARATRSHPSGLRSPHRVGRSARRPAVPSGALDDCTATKDARSAMLRGVAMWRLVTEGTARATRSHPSGAGSPRWVGRSAWLPAGPYGALADHTGRIVAVGGKGLFARRWCISKPSGTGLRAAYRRSLAPFV